MNKEIFTLWVNCKPPFHQKVVRSNYEIPEPLLKKCVELVLEDTSELVYCDDFLEISYQTLSTANSISKQALLDRFTELVQKPRGTAVRIFDKSHSFYLRIILAPKEEFGTDEMFYGGFELYGEEEQMQQVYNVFCKEINAHFILEGAKKYLDEISEV